MEQKTSVLRQIRVRRLTHHSHQQKKVTLYQLSASEHLIVKTQELVNAVKSPEMVKEYCLVKGDQNSFWKLLGARLRGNAALIEELGYNPESVSIALMKLVEDKKRVEPVDATLNTSQPSQTCLRYPNSLTL